MHLPLAEGRRSVGRRTVAGPVLGSQERRAHVSVAVVPPGATAQVLLLQLAAGNRATRQLLPQDLTSNAPTVMRQELPRADMGPRSSGRAFRLDWESHHREIEQDATLREAFEANLATEIERHFGERLTQQEVVANVRNAEAAGNAGEAERLRRLLRRANHFAVAATLDVEGSARYRAVGERGQPGRKTYCNIYAYDFVTALGAYLPRVWWDSAALRRIRAGEEVPVRYPPRNDPSSGTIRELRANDLTDWMAEFGGDFGWRRAAGLTEAQEAANDGRVVILLAARTNPRRSGHITVVMPEIRAEDDVRDSVGEVVRHEAGRDAAGEVDRPMQSEAGGSNTEYAASGAGWLAGSTYRDGAAWVFEGRVESSLLTPEQLGYVADEQSGGAQSPPTGAETAGTAAESDTSEPASSATGTEVATTFDADRAVRLNARWGERLGWVGRVDDVVAHLQELELLPRNMSPAPHLLAEAVYHFQQVHGGLTADGIIGRNTWRALAPRLPATARTPPAEPALGGPGAPARSDRADWTTVSADERMAYVVGRLVDTYGLPVEGAAGLVGNLSAESGVLPNRIEGSRPDAPMTAPAFGDGRRELTPEEVMDRDTGSEQGPRRAGVGLAQWTSPGRRRGLFQHEYEGQVLGAAILGNMDAQVDYLVSELRSSYAGVYRTIMTGDLEAASDDVLYRFEIPGAILENRRKLPRSDPRVHAVLERRRAASRRALEAYRAGRQ